MTTENTTEAITIHIGHLKSNGYSSRRYNADVFCACCGRGMTSRAKAWVTICSQPDADGNVTFQPIPDSVIGFDSVEWGTFIGPRCAKMLPKSHKISQRRVMTAWVKNGCP